MVMVRALLIAALASAGVAASPIHAAALAPKGVPGKPAKAGKIKVHRVARPTTPPAGAANSVARAVPVAASHSSFFATPLGLLTLAGGAGGAASAAALAAPGSPSSPQ